MFHIKRQTLKGEYFIEFVESIHSNLPNYLTYSFVDIYAFIIDFIASIHYRMKYLKFFDMEERNNMDEKNIQKFQLFSNEFLVEDSVINCCFNGKFMAVSKCRNCSELIYIEEDFLSLNFDVFKTGQSKHIRELRNNFGDEDKQRGFFKVFSTDYWKQEI